MSLQLNALIVSYSTSCTDDGLKTTDGWSPCVPHFACITSDWLGPVGKPVEGPLLITLTITHGISAIQAKPSPSCIREKPGPLVAVNDFVPPSEAPMIAQIEAISSSICIKTPPIFGSLTERISATSVEGVIG